jgi:hypothetical protein
VTASAGKLVYINVSSNITITLCIHITQGGKIIIDEHMGRHCIWHGLTRIGLYHLLCIM